MCICTSTCTLQVYSVHVPNMYAHVLQLLVVIIAYYFSCLLRWHGGQLFPKVIHHQFISHSNTVGVPTRLLVTASTPDYGDIDRV